VNVASPVSRFTLIYIHVNIDTGGISGCAPSLSHLEDVCSAFFCRAQL
jgi:hypothetical protein